MLQETGRPRPGFVFFFDSAMPMAALRANSLRREFGREFFPAEKKSFLEPA